MSAGGTPLKELERPKQSLVVREGFAIARLCIVVAGGPGHGWTNVGDDLHHQHGQESGYKHLQQPVTVVVQYSFWR